MLDFNYEIIVEENKAPLLNSTMHLYLLCNISILLYCLIRKLGRSIEERDPAVLSREKSGHWEVDLMIGKKTKTEPVILTMVERKTRILLTKKVWGQSAEIIQKATLQLMESHGLEHFQSLTTDNGLEFSTLSLIEEDVPGLEGFFTHAYAAWEKGTNERHNGLLREFIAKGESLSSLTYRELKKYPDAINQRPRRILNYETPLEATFRNVND